MVSQNNVVPVYVIGLDGATHEVLHPLLELGALPNLHSLIKEGMSCNLESTMPPVTGPAWFAMATGMSPGRTGVFDFRNRSRDTSLALNRISSIAIRGRAYWDLLSDAGERVCVFNYPMLYPAYPLNGIMVSGLLSPLDGAIAYPASLRDELEQATGGYTIEIPFSDPRYIGREQELVSDLLKLLDKHTRAIELLLSKGPWDLFVAVLTVTDVAQHYLWKHWDPGHPDHDPAGSSSLRQAFIDVWRRVDDVVGTIRQHVESNGYVLVVSDHGFGPLEATFHINEWLHQQGFLTWKSSTQSTLNQAVAFLASKAPAAIGMIPQSIRKTRVAGLARTDILNLVDLEYTRAVMPAVSDICGQIYLNRALCGPFGSTGYDRAVDEIIHSLHQLPANLGVNLDLEIHKATDLYHGPYQAMAPDIFVILDDFRCRVTAQRGHPIYRRGSGNPNRTGIHRSDGIMIAQGSGLPGGYSRDLHIIDIAPTILQIKGLSVPPSMDGISLFDSPFTAGIEPAAIEGDDEGCATDNDARSEFSEDEEADLLERLRGLGYV